MLRLARSRFSWTNSSKKEIPGLCPCTGDDAVKEVVHVGCVGQTELPRPRSGYCEVRG